MFLEQEDYYTEAQMVELMEKVEILKIIELE
jgi:hypothetical protein